ncbi:MAG: right-handed parallel beta-helix repeat-containing protein [Actinobacteria bacterium]|nr:right-handed parallel beta-helix repeat-containing protein [Actinomycetota bacterium]
MTPGPGLAGRARRPSWLVVVIALVLSPLGTRPAGAHPVEPAPPSVDVCSIERSADSPGEAIGTGTSDRDRFEEFSPFRVTKYPCPRAPDVRSLYVAPGVLELTEGGRLARRIDFPSSAQGPVSFEAIVEAVADPEWATEVEPGVFELTAAFVQAPGTTVTIAAPRVQTLRLVDRPGVFFGGRGATARFEGVAVTSWSRERQAPDEEPADGRPFVLYQEAARLDVVNSEMSYLGSDRGSAYGVAWRLGGSTGEVLGSTFAHNFFGVYTFEATGIVFRDNVFRDNILYGFDPHDFTTGLVVEDNVAYGNGSHGFIVSRGVTDSVLRRNHSHDNAGNGIMMDSSSDRNRIEANLVENNAKDGIVLLGSADNVVVDNVVRGNRVGIRVNGLESTANRIEGNLIEGHEIGLQAYGGAADMVAIDNTVLDSSQMGMALEAPRSQVGGGEIRRAPRGVGIRTATSLSGMRISDVDEGVVVAATGIADLEQLQVSARESSLRVEDGGLIELRGSTMIPPPPFDQPSAPADDNAWLPFAGVAAILTALLLELIRWRRERHDDVTPAPAQVWNRA